MINKVVYHEEILHNSINLTFFCGVPETVITRRAARLLVWTSIVTWLEPGSLFSASPTGFCVNPQPTTDLSWLTMAHSSDTDGRQFDDFRRLWNPHCLMPVLHTPMLDESPVYWTTSWFINQIKYSNITFYQYFHSQLEKIFVREIEMDGDILK